MASIYLFCLIVGGFFVGMSALSGGHHDSDASADGLHAGDLHLHLDGASPAQVVEQLHLDMSTDVAHLPCEVSADHASEVLGGDHSAAEAGHCDALWLPFLSFRFWTFGSCFFGMTGSLLGAVTTTGPIVTFLVSSGMGAICGTTAAWVVKYLRDSHVSGLTSHDDYVGSIACVIVPIEEGGLGKIRLTHHGQMIDLVARSDEKGLLPVSTKVLVIGFANDEALVVHAGRLLSSTP